LIRACFFAFIIGNFNGKGEQAIERILFLKRKGDRLFDDEMLVK
jgi:hypothetical protein